MTAQGPAFQSGRLQVWRASQSRVGSVSKIDPLPATVFPLPSQPHCRKAAYLDIRTDALIDDPMPRLICRAVYLSAKGRGRRLPKSVSAMMVAFIATLAVFHGRPALADATCGWRLHPILHSSAFLCQHGIKPLCLPGMSSGQTGSFWPCQTAMSAEWEIRLHLGTSRQWRTCPRLHHATGTRRDTLVRCGSCERRSRCRKRPDAPWRIPANQVLG